MNTKHFSTLFVLQAIAASLLVVGCGGASEPRAASPASAASAATGASAPASGARSGGAPVAVTTAQAKKRDFDVKLEAIGTVTAMSSVDVKAQVNSVVTKVHVKEGQFVKVGELLFTLDPRPDEANVAKVRAQMLKDEAVLADAQRQLARSRDLMAMNFISQGALDTAQAQVDAQQANLAADKAALDAAQLALSYNRVRASGSGRLGAINVFAGTAVQANLTTLVTLTQLDPINVSFNLPQRNLDAILQGLKAGGVAVNAKLPESKVEIKGRLQFVDNAVDAPTGTIKVRARFDNSDLKLWPGAFVSTELLSHTIQDAVVIPTAAVIQSSRGAIVYVAANGKAALRPVKVLATQGAESAVTGVVLGDKVVMEGRQNLRPESALVERAPGGSGPRSGASAPVSAAASAASAS
jgi:RND family efflux transporter MFP subunit